MINKLFIPFIGLLIGVVIGLYSIIPQITKNITLIHTKDAGKKQVIGFLPYWLLNKAKSNYSDYITTLTYFGLNVGGNGNIIKLANPQEKDPGWNALSSGKLDTFLTNARKNNVKLSLLLSSGDSESINQLLANPIGHANTLMKDVMPIMKRYSFTDLNLDIEYTATPAAITQKHFTQFVQTIKQQINSHHLGTLTIEISPTDVIKQEIINIQSIAPFADAIVLMAYDYHSPTSNVTGPVAPLNGAGISSEYDVTTAVEKSLQIMQPEKLILGIPLYGYEWETLNTAVRSAPIPGTGVMASNNRMESFLSSCATCSAFFDNEAQEVFVVYQNQDTGTYHQISFPNQESMKAKVTLANTKQLGGVALWALGYEGSNILDPLVTYKP
ncbi:MAG TPA: glycoside hydrolase family 18 protein [Candidatus Sulfotelmatobacter sp.]|jgi:spore germination protein YaaH|nr:glycoside hydrolase family 18 protein [Candidatus Sulfotelmatobacter sp.]